MMSQNVSLHLPDEIAAIEFRDTLIGRQPFVKETGMAVWEFVMISQRFGLDAERTADFLQYPVESVNVALDYYHAHRWEIDQALAENHIEEDHLKRLFPHLRFLSMPQHEERQPS